MNPNPKRTARRSPQPLADPPHIHGRSLARVLHAKWEHVDFERGLTFLPESKTGKKAIVLSAVALDV